MRSLPVAAKLYLLAVCLLGAASLVVSQLIHFPPSSSRPWEIWLFVALALIAGGRKVTLSKKLLNEEVGSMSLGFAITFTAMLRFGPGMAVLIGCVSNLSSCLFPKRQALHQVLFNVALGAFEALLGGLVFVWLSGWTLELNTAQTFLAVAASAVTSFALNTFGVATIIAFCSNGNPLRIWRESFLWTGPSYFASASVGALAILVFRGSISGTLLFIAPVIYLVYQSYVVYISRAEEKIEHMEEMQLSQQHLAELYLATIRSLALAIDAKDQYTHQHILRVQRYAVAIAEEMGLTGAELEAVNTGALLHDIGKLGVPEYVLVKPGRLTPEEFDKIKKHPEIGAAILGPVEFPWPVLPVVRSHHEKWDGSGYPDGLKGEEIPLTARIMAVADVYDALTSTRSYRGAWPHEKAVITITRDAGTHFDPDVVQVFLRVIDQVVAEMAEQGEGPLVPKAEGEKDSPANQVAKDISRAAEEIWALYEVSQSLSSSIGTADTFQILSRKLSAVFPGICCALLLVQEDGKLWVKAAHGVNAPYFESGYTVGENSLSAQVSKEQTAYSGEFNREDIMLSANQLEPWHELQQCLIVPIVHEGKCLGTINLYDPENYGFTEYDQNLLELIANSAAPAIFNAIIFDRNHNNELVDQLTGLVGIRCLSDSLQSMCKDEKPFSLLCIDLESFRSINEAFGHSQGDRVLKDLGRRLHDLVGEEVLVARIGGDEFAIITAGDGLDLASLVVEEIEAYHPGLVAPGFGELRITATVGVACFPESATNAASMISAADGDLRRNKSARRLKALSRPIRRAAA